MKGRARTVEIKIHDMAQDAKTLQGFRDLNVAYGKKVDKKYQERLKKSRKADKELRDFCITF